MENWRKFYLYSIALGARYLFRNPFRFSKETIKRIVIPMDVFRYFEIPATFSKLKPKAGERILDLSSPKLLSFYLAEKYNVKIYATDIWKKEISIWRKLKKGIHSRRLNRNVSLQVVDGRALPYPRNYFDKIFSVSVIEHIEKDGDTLCMLELARVLKPGGIAVVTLPLARKYFEKWVDRNVYANKFENKTLFSYRKYDRKTLKSRIIDPSGLFLEKSIICEEKHYWIYHLYAAFSPLSVIFGLLFPIWARLALKEGSKKGDSWCILLVLKKN